MSERGAVIVGSPPTHPEAKQDDEGRWRMPDGRPLPVSASDLERFTYCRMSWHLSATGTNGTSEAIERGIAEHRSIHEAIVSLGEHRFQTRRNLLIWEWWYAVIVVLLIDTLAFQYIDDVGLNVVEFSRLLATGALSFLLVGLVAVLVPWRRVIGLNAPFRPERQGHVDAVEPVFEPRGFMGGWFEGGLLEALMFVSAIVLALHSTALLFADNRDQASSVLAATTLGWTLLASTLLRKALKNNEEARRLAVENDLDMDAEVSYSDDDATTALLIDKETGLRGRPDQIVIIDSEFIPVEQKTGKVPKRPHASHRFQALAYARLVEMTTGRAPPYALLRYGQNNLHQLPWDQSAKDELQEQIQAIQHIMAKGGATRNHNRPGKCKNCSRRHACAERIV